MTMVWSLQTPRNGPHPHPGTTLLRTTGETKDTLDIKTKGLRPSEPFPCWAQVLLSVNISLAEPILQGSSEAQIMAVKCLYTQKMVYL